MTKMNEINGMKEEQLARLLVERRNALREAYFQLSGGKLKNSRVIRVARKDIARILTRLALLRQIA
ncbi:MAG: 50S ribosomal protein L29 [Parcubacteria group bacterium]|nr:50S ribosomal protein L29 [Parcubacteria group bacterium]MBI2175580.1 50S ribosomal protein L29 [Parcubacteria group bacterium]